MSGFSPSSNSGSCPSYMHLQSSSSCKLPNKLLPVFYYIFPFMYIEVDTLFVVFLRKTKGMQPQSCCFGADLIMKALLHPLLEQVCREIGLTPFVAVGLHVLQAGNTHHESDLVSLLYPCLSPRRARFPLPCHPSPQ